MKRFFRINNNKIKCVAALKKVCPDGLLRLDKHKYWFLVATTAAAGWWWWGWWVGYGWRRRRRRSGGGGGCGGEFECVLKEGGRVGDGTRATHQVRGITVLVERAWRQEIILERVQHLVGTLHHRLVVVPDKVFQRLRPILVLLYLHILQYKKTIRLVSKRQIFPLY